MQVYLNVKVTTQVIVRLVQYAHPQGVLVVVFSPPRPSLPRREAHSSVNGLELDVRTHEDEMWCKVSTETTPDRDSALGLQKKKNKCQHLLDAHWRLQAAQIRYRNAIAKPSDRRGLLIEPCDPDEKPNCIEDKRCRKTFLIRSFEDQNQGNHEKEKLAER